MRINRLENWQIAAMVAEGRYFVSESPEVGTRWEDVEQHLNDGGWTVSITQQKTYQGFCWEAAIYCPLTGDCVYGSAETREEAFKFCYRKCKTQRREELQEAIKQVVRVGKDRKKLTEGTVEVLQAASGRRRL